MTLGGLAIIALSIGTPSLLVSLSRNEEVRVARDDALKAATIWGAILGSAATTAFALAITLFGTAREKPTANS